MRIGAYRPFDMQPVQPSRLERLSVHQTLGLVQLLYHAAISTRREYHRLENDVSKLQAKRMAQRAELRVEKSSNRKLRAGQTNLQAYFSQRLASNVPICTICLEDRADTALECGHVYCGHCLGEWQGPFCPSCREPRGNGRRLYFP